MTGMSNQILQKIIGASIASKRYLRWEMTWASFIDSAPPGQNCRHFTDDKINYIVVNQKLCIFIRIPLEFSYGSNWKQVSIGSIMGLVLNKR